MVNGNSILGKLGGAAFVTATGAKSIDVSRDEVTFRIPTKTARDGINIIVISVNAARDAYDAKFFKGGRLMKGATTRFDTLVYANFDLGGSELRTCFTYATGIDVAHLEML